MRRRRTIVATQIVALIALAISTAFTEAGTYWNLYTVAAPLGIGGVALAYKGNRDLSNGSDFGFSSGFDNLGLSPPATVMAGNGNGNGNGNVGSFNGNGNSGNMNGNNNYGNGYGNFNATSNNENGFWWMSPQNLNAVQEELCRRTGNCGLKRGH
jgi:hypothetical protein